MQLLLVILKKLCNHFDNFILEHRFYSINIIIAAGKKDRRGLSIAHLAVMCTGSDPDFEETLNVLNGIW